MRRLTVNTYDEGRGSFEFDEPSAAELERRGRLAAGAG
jgi:hypothetical protein